MTILRRHFPGYRLNFKPVSCDAERGAPVRRVIVQDQGLSVDLVGERPPPESQALRPAPTPTSGRCPPQRPLGQIPSGRRPRTERMEAGLGG